MILMSNQNEQLHPSNFLKESVSSCLVNTATVAPHQQQMKSQMAYPVRFRTAYIMYSMDRHREIREAHAKQQSSSGSKSLRVGITKQRVSPQTQLPIALLATNTSPFFMHAYCRLLILPRSLPKNGSPCLRPIEKFGSTEATQTNNATVEKCKSTRFLILPGPYHLVPSAQCRPTWLFQIAVEVSFSGSILKRTIPSCHDFLQKPGKQRQQKLRRSIVKKKGASESCTSWK